MAQNRKPLRAREDCFIIRYILNRFKTYELDNGCRICSNAKPWEHTQCLDAYLRSRQFWMSSSFLAARVVLAARLKSSFVDFLSTKGPDRGCVS